MITTYLQSYMPVGAEQAQNFWINGLYGQRGPVPTIAQSSASIRASQQQFGNSMAAGHGAGWPTWVLAIALVLAGSAIIVALDRAG